MSDLVITLKYMALVHSDNGLTVLLPSAKHDASLTVDGLAPIPLKSAQVTFLKNDKLLAGNAKAQATSTDGLLLVKDVMRISEAPVGNEDPVPFRRVLQDDIDTIPEIHARISLPNGTLSADQSRTSAYGFVNGTEVVMMGSDTLYYTISRVAGSDYALRIESGGKTTDIDVTSAKSVIIANADRKTKNTKAHPWYEFASLLDLLDLIEMDYIFPEQIGAITASTPETDPCGSIVTGELS